ncbi:MAG: AsmA family protein [Methylococcales bacterium]
MKKSLKATFLLLGVFSVVLLLVGISLFLLINPNAFKPELSALVKQHTGRVLTIPGDLKLAIFPAPGIKIGKMALSNAANFPDQPFAEVASAQISIKWLPLLTNKFELGKIQLEGLSLNLSKNKQGETNWSDLNKLSETTAINTPLDIKDSDETAVAKLLVEELSVAHGHIVWQDQQAERMIDLNAVQITVNKLGVDRPIALSLGFNLTKPGMNSVHKIQLSTQLTLNNALDRLSAKDIKVNSLSTGEQIPGEQLKLAGLVKAIEYQPTLQTIKVEGLQLNTQNVTINADVSGRQLRDNPDIRGTAQVAAFNVKEFMRLQGLVVPVMQDPTVLDSLVADLSVQATDHSVTFNNVNLRLDQSSLKGSAELTDFKQPAMIFSAEIDTLNADRYFAPQANIPSPILSSAVVVAATDQALQPLERLKNLALNGNILIRQLHMKQLDLQDVNLAIQSKAGQIQTQQTIKGLFQGSYQGNASLALLDNIPKVSVDEKIAHINVESLLHALNSKTALTGVMNASAQLHGQGDSTQALKASLAGDIQFLLENTAIKGLNIQKLLDSVKSLISGQAIPSALKTGQSVFNQVQGTANVKGGIIENHDLVATSASVLMTGEGQVDLNTDQIAYTLKARLLNAATPIKETDAWPLSLKIGGKLNNPSFTVDIVDALLEENKLKIEEKKTELLEKLDKTLHKKLGIGTSELLKKLF